MICGKLREPWMHCWIFQLFNQQFSNSWKHFQESISWTRMTRSIWIQFFKILMEILLFITFLGKLTRWKFSYKFSEIFSTSSCSQNLLILFRDIVDLTVKNSNFYNSKIVELLYNGNFSQLVRYRKKNSRVIYLFYLIRSWSRC